MEGNKNQRREINLEDFDFKKIGKKWLLRGTASLLLFCVLFYFIDPSIVNGLFFSFLVEGLPYLLLGIFFLFFIYKALVAYAKKNQARATMWGILAMSTFIFGTMLFNKVSEYYMYHKVASDITELDAYIPVNKNVFRFTPRIVAYNQMESTVRARTEKVDWEHARPYLQDDGFGYVAPITPDGLRPQYMKKNPGFIKYEDDFDKDTVIQRIDQPFEIGEEMLYTDNIERQLYFDDFFAQYPRIHYITLGDPDKFYAVAPKIKYKYGFPFFFIPYWSGSAVIDEAGNITNYTREEIKTDPRFKGKWMAPLALMREYIAVQDYAVGFWNTFTSIDGMLSIPNLPNNEYPLVIYTDSGDTYLVIDTEPQGSGRGLFRMYYQNAQTGEIFMYEPPSTEPIIGPRGAMSKVYSLKGYHWFDGNSGTMVALEPCYLTKNEGGKEVLYWKFSISSLDKTRVSATVVVEATEGGEMIEFIEREDFENWLQSKEVISNTIDPSNPNITSPSIGGTDMDIRLQKVEGLLQEALRELNALKQVERDTTIK
jgi:hypothetical protein